MKNRDISKELSHIADLLEMREIQWKPQAYRSAARQILNMKEDVEMIYREEGERGLENINAVGSRLAKHIADFIKKGRVKEWERLKKGSVKGLHELVNVEGLGPKRIKKLFEQLNVQSVKDLEMAIDQHKIRDLEGFGEKTELNLKKAIEQYKKGHKRMFIDFAWNIAHEVVDYLKEKAALRKIDIAGSLRRMKETIGDIDLLASSDNPQKLMDAFTAMPSVLRIIGKGKTKSSVVLNEGVQVDLRIVEEGSYGAALLYFTGSKEHNIALRKMAIDQGHKLSEYGLADKKSNQKIAQKTEEEVYKKLGLAWIPPEMRENTGELDLAQKHHLPSLVELKDIRGDLQMHTQYSDGLHSIQDMADKAHQMGYEYIAITDHSKSQHIAHGMKEDRIKKQWKEIEEVNRANKIKVLKGAEVNILNDGRLDYDDKILKELDVVLIAIHTGFKSGREAMTKRILTALDHPLVNILVHPTGRMIHRREGYDADFNAIFKKCKAKNVALEINAHPHRLDLNDHMIRRAVQCGVKFSLGTDSHHKDALENMRFGVGQARRGWLKKEDIINTMDYENLMSFLKSSQY